MYNDQYFQQPMPLFQGYGLNSAYATPAYMANFRPAYAQSGPGQYNPYDLSGGYSEGRLTDTLLPFPLVNSSTYNVDPLSYSAALSYDATSKITDFGMSAAQRVGTPLAMWYLSNKMLNAKIGAGAGSMSHGMAKASAFATTFMRGEGISAATRAAASAAGTHSIATAMGTGVGRGLGSLAGGIFSTATRAVGLGSATGVAAGMAGVGGIVGGLAGGLALPWAAAIGASKLVEDAAFDPYISTRRGMDSALANTANQFIGGANSTVSGRFGMSHMHAYDVSKKLSQAGARDFAFEQQDYNIINDYATRAGLMNDLGSMNTEDVTRRVEGMAKSVKLIMAIANTSSVKEAIDYLGKIKAMGVSNPAVANQVMRSLGGASGISGSSVDQIMNTVGAQSQFMFQQRGLMPVLGQMSGAATYAGFANAYKTGLLSTETMASIGGVEGATQNVMEGSLNILSRPTTMMDLMTGRDFKSDLIGTMSEFGQRSAADPMGFMGDMVLNKDFYASKAIAEKGLGAATYESLIKSLGPTINVLGETGGKTDITKLAGMMGLQGMPEEQVRSLVSSWQATADISSQQRAREARLAQVTRTNAQRQNQEGMMFAGIGIGREWYDLKADYKDIKADYLTPFFSAPAKWMGRMSDYVEETTNLWMGIEPSTHRKEFDIDEKTGDVTSYQLKGHKITRASTNSSYAMMGIGGDTSVEYKEDDESKVRMNESLFRQIKALRGEDTDQGKRAERIFQAFLNKGNGMTRDQLSHDIYEFDKSVKGVALGNAEFSSNTAAGQATEVTDQILGGLVGIEKKIAKKDEQERKLKGGIADAMGMREERVDNGGYLTNRELFGGPAVDPRLNKPIQQMSEGLVNKLGDAHLNVLMGVLDGEKSSDAMTSEVMKSSAAYKEAMEVKKAGKTLTKEQSDILELPRFFATMSGLDKKDISAAMEGGEESSEYLDLMEKMSGQDSAIDKNLAKVTKNTLDRLGKEDKDALIFKIAKGRPMVAQSLYQNGVEKTLSNRSTLRLAAQSVQEAKSQDSEQKKEDDLGSTLRNSTVNLTTAIKDMSEVSSAIKKFSGNIDGSADKMGSAATSIQEAAKVINKDMTTTLTGLDKSIKEMTEVLKGAGKGSSPLDPTPSSGFQGFGFLRSN